jgi:uncharacterized membrane protein
MKNFFSSEESAKIVAAIAQAEKNTSGEIRVHLASKVKGEVLEAAVQTFGKLGMHKTELRNGILIFLVPSQKVFAIYGDQGINEKVPSNFWKEERDLLQQYFKEGQYVDGVCEVVQQVGEKLQTFFPIQPDDKNELSNEISFDA